MTGPRNSLKQKFGVATKFASIKLQNSKAGTYRYTFTGVSDGIYSQNDLKRFDFKEFAVKQTVNPLPLAGFVDRGKDYKICVNTDPEDHTVDPIALTFTGKAPFSVELTVHHEATGKYEKVSLEGIKEKKHFLRDVYQGLGLGKHTVTLNSVSDANGCGRKINKADERVQISVSDVPSVAEINSKTDYCVGERIKFNLNGVAPFEVTYEFNGQKQRTTTSSQFSRLAAQPGNLTLLSLSDSSSSCQVNLAKNNVKHVHEIPSVEVTEGETIIQDLNGGDQAEIIFHFKGTPPFSFIYTRSECVSHGRRGTPRCKVVETIPVKNINEMSYSILTSLQGTYQATAVEDKWCSYNSDELEQTKRF